MPFRANLPSITRILLPVLILQSILGMVIRYRHATQLSEVIIAWLVFLPSHSLFYPWTMLTATLVENNLITLTIATLTIFYGGRYLERAWTSAEFAKFLLIVSLIPNLFCYGELTLLFVLTGNAHWINTTIHGTLPLQISFLVAFSQLIPAHTVTIFKGLISVRVTQLPLLHVLGVTLLVLTPILSVASFFLVVSAFITSWTYLRFYKHIFPDLQTSQSSLRGDRSETFAFAEFFPDLVKPVVASVSDKIYSLLVTLRICKPFSTDLPSTHGELYMQRGAPGSVRAETERRRALALKALDQRLHAATVSHSKIVNSLPSTLVGPSNQTQTQPVGLELDNFNEDTNYIPDRRPENEKTTQLQ